MFDHYQENEHRFHLHLNLDLENTDIQILIQ